MWRVWSLLSEIRGALAQGCSLVNEEWRPQFIARNRDGPRRNDVYAVCLSLLAWGSACGSLTPLTLQVCISARGAAANAVPARRPRRPPYSPPPPPPARAAAARTAAAAAVREAARPRRPVTAPPHKRPATTQAAPGQRRAGARLQSWRRAGARLLSLLSPGALLLSRRRAPRGR